MENPLKISANIFKKKEENSNNCMLRRGREKKSNLKIHKDPDEWTEWRDYSLIIINPFREKIKKEKHLTKTTLSKRSEFFFRGLLFISLMISLLDLSATTFLSSFSLLAAQLEHVNLLVGR